MADVRLAEGRNAGLYLSLSISLSQSLSLSLSLSHHVAEVLEVADVRLAQGRERQVDGPSLQRRRAHQLRRVRPAAASINTAIAALRSLLLHCCDWCDY